MRSLAGKNAIVTGASRGLGVYIARALAAEGVNLVLVARSLEPIEQLAAELSQQGIRALAVRADVAVAADRQQLLQRAETELGAIDVLVNNAGLEANAAYASFSAEEIEHMLQVDLLAPMLLTRALLPAMLQRKAGHIVNIASLAGKCGIPYNVPYSAAKGGLIMFTHSLWAELAGTGVRTSVIVPGYIADTGMIASKAREHAIDVPILVGTVKPAAVARRVVTALRWGRLDIYVTPGPIRLLLAFYQLLPALTSWFFARIGVLEPFRRVAVANRRGP